MLSAFRAYAEKAGWPEWLPPSRHDMLAMLHEKPIGQTVDFSVARLLPYVTHSVRWEHQEAGPVARGAAGHCHRS
jgi:hypothetical protein